MIFDLDCFHKPLSQEEGGKQLEILLAVFLQVEVVEVQEQEAVAEAVAAAEAAEAVAVAAAAEAVAAAAVAVALEPAWDLQECPENH